MAGDRVVNLTVSTFNNEVLNSQIPVLVDFWAPWCGPCRRVGPLIDELADDYADKIKFCKLNVSDEGELAVKYGVMTIPTVILFKNGEEAERMLAAPAKAGFNEMLDKYIS